MRRAPANVSEIYTVTIRLADISEFQANIDARAYLGGGFGCLIVRAHNGNRADHLWPARRDYLRGFPFVALGFYQYLVSNRDAATQAREFVNTVGPLRANEFAILDHESGSGSQVARAEAWFKVVDAAYGMRATLYAGESFGRTNLGGWARWAGRPRWIAAYRASEPTDPHDLWQRSDAGHFPGLSGGVDESIFHGNEQQFLQTMRAGAPSVAPPTEDQIVAISSVVAANGNLHVFVEAKDGRIFYTYQRKDETAWQGGKAGVSVAALSYFAPAPK